MLQQGLRACPIGELSGTDSHGLTLLHVAAMRDSVGCVKALIDAGFDVKAKSAAGWLPYQEAANYRCSFLANGIAPEQSSAGTTPYSD
jgi:ankyrin repeat protein